MKMRKQIINNLTRSEEPAKRFCHVVKPLGDGRYQVRDGAGRHFDVDAETGVNWQPGDGVAVRDLRIIGRAARWRTPTIYEV